MQSGDEKRHDASEPLGAARSGAETSPASATAEPRPPDTAAAPEVPLPDPTVVARVLADCDVLLAEANAVETSDPARAARLHHAVGALHALYLRGGGDAISYYECALVLDSACLPALRDLRAALAERESWPRVAELYEAELAVTETPAERAELLFEQALLDIRERHETQAAVERLEQARTLVPGERRVLALLESLYFEHGQWNELRRTLERQAEATADPVERAHALRALGAVLEGPLGAPEAAIETYLLAVAAHPSNATALVALRRLCHKHGRSAELATTLQRLAALVPEPTERWLHYYLIAEIHAARHGDVDEALRYLEEALEVAPENLLVLRELVRLYEQRARWPDLVRVLDRLVALVFEPREQALLHFQLGEIYEERLHKPDDACTAFRKALAVAPLHTPTLRALDRLFLAQHRYGELAELRAEQAERIVDPALRAELFYSVGRLHERELDAVTRATDFYERALGVAPGFAPALSALRRTLPKAERWADLVAIYRREAEASQDVERAVALLTEAAWLSEHRLHDPGAAIDCYRAVLALTPEHRPTLMSLDRLLEEQGAFAELVENLETQIALTTDPSLQVALLGRIGALHETELARPERALEAYRRAHTLDPNHLPTIRRLQRHYRREERWADLAGAYEAELNAGPPRPEAVQLHYEIGELRRARLGQSDAAVESFERALTLDPGHAPSRRALAAIFAARRDWPALIARHQAEAEATAAVPERAILRYRVGELWEQRADDADHAVANYRQSLSDDPLAVASHWGLARIYGARGQWNRLVAVLRDIATHARADESRIHALLYAAHVQTFLGEDLAGAAGDYDKVLQIDAARVEALDGLYRVLRRRGDWRRAAAILERRAALAETPADRAHFAEELAGLLTTRLRPPEDPTAVLYPLHEAALASNWALTQLSLTLTHKGDHERLASVLARRAAAESRPNLRADAFLRLARLLERHERFVPSEAGYVQALDAGALDLPAVQGRRRLAEKLGRPELVARTLEDQARLHRDRLWARRSAIAAARQWRDTLGKPDEARRVLEWLLARDPEAEEAFAALRELLTERADWLSLDQALARQVQAATNDEVRASYLWELAEVRRHRRAPPAGPKAAVEALRELLELVPRHEAALRALADLYREDGRAQEALEALASLRRATRDERTAVTALLEAATLRANALGDTAGAKALCDEALRLVPRHRGALEHLAALHIRDGEWRAAADTLRLLHDGANPADQARYLLDLALVCDRGLSEWDNARRAALQAAALAPDSAAPLRVLEDLHARAGDRPGLMRLLRQLLGAAPPGQPLAAAQVHLALARAHDRLGGDLPAALDEARQAVECAPTLIDARLLRATLLERAAPDFGPALAELRFVVRHNPFHPAALAHAQRLWAHDGVGGALGIAALRRWLGEPDLPGVPLERYRARPFAVRRVTLDAESYARLVAHPDEQPALGELLQAVAPFLVAARPGDIGLYGVGPAERLVPRTGDPVTSALAQVVEPLGIDPPTVYVSPTRPQAAAVLAGQPLVVVLGHELVTGADPAALRYQFGRLLGPLPAGNLPALLLSERAFVAFVEGLVVTLTGNAKLIPEFNPVAAALGVEVAKALPRKVRRVAESAAARLAARPPLLPARHHRAVVLTGERVGYVLADEPAAPFGAILRRLGPAGLDPQSTTGRRWLGEEPLVQELADYLLSPGYDAVRRLWGLV